MKEYRINVRFNLENETDRMIVAYLDGLRGTQKVSRNQFIINAIYEQIVEGKRNTALNRSAPYYEKNYPRSASPRYPKNRANRNRTFHSM